MHEGRRVHVAGEPALSTRLSWSAGCISPPSAGVLQRRSYRHNAPFMMLTPPKALLDCNGQGRELRVEVAVRRRCRCSAGQYY